MIDLKADFSGGLNLDDSYYILPKNCYIDAQNITRDAVAGSNDRSITNVIGNRASGVITTSYTIVKTTYQNATIFIESPDVISAGTRTLIELNQLPSLTPRVVLDYTSTQSFSATDYCNELATAMQSSISVANLWTFTGTIADGVYTVSPSSTTGVGFGSSFELYFNSNTYSGSVILYGGTNYKAGNPFAGADFITFNGSLFGGVDGVDDVVLYVDAVSLPSGIISNGSAAGPPPNFYFEYNDDIANPFNAYQWSYYTITLGRVNAGYTCIGAYPNTIRNTIIYFLHNNLGYHQILEYNIQTELVTKILENLVDTGGVDILNFDVTKKITSVNIYNRDEGDLLYFLDTLGRPTGLDIALFKLGEYTPVTRDIIDVCKRPPLAPPNWQYKNDTTKVSNNLRDKFFRFKYRYVYDDLTKSVCSPISTMQIPTNLLNFEYYNTVSNNNNIYLQCNTGDKDVKRIELMMSYVNKTNDWSDFQIIETLNKQVEYTVYSNIDVGPPFVQNTRINFFGTPIPGAQVTIYYQFGPIYQVAISVIQPGWSITDLVNDLQQSCILTSTVDNNSLVIAVDPLTAGLFSSVQIEYLDGVDNVDIAFYFYNDSTYPNVDINESVQLYDYVPTYAKAQELANGNVLVYGAITEGYDRVLSPNVIVDVLKIPAGPGNSGLGSITISAEDTSVMNGLTERPITRYRFYGLPPAGTTIELYVKNNSGTTLLVSYTTTLTDTIATIPQHIYDTGQLIGWGVPVYMLNTGVLNGNNFQNVLQIGYYKNNPYIHSRQTITYPLNTVRDNPLATFLFNTERNIGIAYFDKKGKTNGILWNESVSMPSYSENNAGQVLLPYINTKIYHRPPLWAHSFQFYLTKENTQFLYWFVQADINDPNYIFFDLSFLTLQQEASPTTAAVCSWSFQDGDRVRIIKRIDSTPFTLFPETYDTQVIGIVTDPIINLQQTTGKTYIKVDRKGVFNIPGAFNPAYYYMIQLYRTNQPKNEIIYYEFGEQYYVLNPETPDRSHLGSVTVQNFTAGIPAEFNFYKGDVYLRQRFFENNSIKNLLTSLSFFPLDRNVTDSYISAVNSISGRPNIIDKNAKEAYYSTLVRFGQPYQPNTNTNNLNRFYFDDFDQYDYTYGDIMRFKIRDRFMRVFQKLKVGMVPLYQQMVKNLDSENLVISDKLLNPVQYYQGDVGIGDNPESLASFNYADFFTSNIKGAICRASQDGVEFISATNKVNSWANAQVGDIDGRTMIGAFDQRLGNYILALGPSVTNNEVTIVYDQEIGNFETFLTLYPEMMVTLGTTLISFRDGIVYVHNNAPYNTWYGAPTADSSITPIFNENPYQKKTFLAVSEISSTLWDIPNMETDLNSYGTTKQTTNIVDSDFAQLEGSYEATILRDINSQGGILGGDTMKGKYIIPTFRKISPSTLVVLNIVSLKYIDSPLTNR